MIGVGSKTGRNEIKGLGWKNSRGVQNERLLKSEQGKQKKQRSVKKKKNGKKRVMKKIDRVVGQK